MGLARGKREGCLQMKMAFGLKTLEDVGKGRARSEIFELVNGGTSWKRREEEGRGGGVALWCGCGKALKAL